MSEIQQVSGGGYQLPVGGTRRSAAAEQLPSGQLADQGTGDNVEISDIAQALARLSELPDIRAEKVAEVRSAIEAGTYETPQKWDVAINRLMEDLADQA